MTDQGEGASAGASPAAKMRRSFRWIALGCGVVVGLPTLLFVAIAWTVDLGAIAKREIDSLKPALEEQLGRKVSVGEVRLSLLPHFAIEARNIAIAAQPRQSGVAAQPLLHIDVVRVGVAVWPMVASFGKRLDVNRIEIESPRLNIVRFADGTLSYQDILDRQSSTETPQQKPLTNAQLDRVDRLSVGRIALTNGELRFRDLQAGPGGKEGTLVTIDKLEVVAENVRIVAPIVVTLDAAVLATERNLHLAATLALPSDLEFGQPLSLFRRAELKLSPVEIEPLLKFLPRHEGIQISRALVDANFALEMPSQSGRLRVVGEAGAIGLQLFRSHTGAVDRGQPADLRVKTDLLIDFVAGEIEAKLIDLSFNALGSRMGVTASADLRSLWTTPAVRSLEMASHDLTFDGLTSLFPPSSLPPRTTLHGPILLSASASGTPDKALLQAALNVDGAIIELPQFHKPAGMALSLGFRGEVKQSGIAVERFGLLLGPLPLLLHGTVNSATRYDLELDSGNVEIDALLRLLPEVESTVAATENLTGTLRMFGHAKRQGEQLATDAHLLLRDAGAKLTTIDLTGQADPLNDDKQVFSLRVDGGPFKLATLHSKLEQFELSDSSTRLTTEAALKIRDEARSNLEAACQMLLHR